MTMMKVKKKKVQKRKLKFEDYKNCLEETQLENKIIHLNNNKIDVKILIENHKEFVKKSKIVLKSQQRLKGKWHNGFTEEICKITLSSNDDKRMQSIDSIETYPLERKKSNM